MSASQPSGPEIDILYELYRKEGDRISPVTSDEDKQIRRPLLVADRTKRVASVADLDEQQNLLHEQVTANLEGVVAVDHVVSFVGYAPSRWDYVTNKWRNVSRGASIAYRVHAEHDDPTTAVLFLNVWTADTTIEAEAAGAG